MAQLHQWLKTSRFIVLFLLFNIVNTTSCYVTHKEQKNQFTKTSEVMNTTKLRRLHLRSPES